MPLLFPAAPGAAKDKGIKIKQTGADVFVFFLCENNISVPGSQRFASGTARFYLSLFKTS